jgi:hypothetical protein
VIQIVGTNAEENARMFGRHFDMDDELVSRITRRSIDLLKENYRVSLTPILIVFSLVYDTDFHLCMLLSTLK